MSGLRIAFMGTPEFSVPCLKALLDAGHDVAAVYSQPPRPAGRGKKDRKSPVHEFAEARGIEVRTPKSLKGEGEQAAFAALELDVAVVVAYGLILPTPILDAPKHGCINVHASLLPRWRGAAPIQRAIMAGDATSGVTTMQMDEGLDTGDMLLMEELTLAPAETGGTLHDKLSLMGSKLIVETLRQLAAGELNPTPQPEDGVTYARKIDKAESRIDWQRTAPELDAHIRGLSPWPGAFFELDGKRIKVIKAEAVSEGGAPGEVLRITDHDNALIIGCAEGALAVNEVQPAGKRAMHVQEYLRGNDVPVGSKVS